MLFWILFYSSIVKKILVSAGKNESWLYAVGADEVVVCHEEEKRCPKLSNRAMDGQAFLSFVVHNYDRLSNTRLAFVHGGKREWHSAPRIEGTVRNSWGRTDLVHLGKPLNRNCMDIASTGWCSNILRPQNISCALYICTYAGLEFMANGVGFRTTTLQQYKGIEVTCNGLDSPPREFGGGYKGCSFAMEYLWQVFAGGPSKLPKQFLLPKQHHNEL